jgi:transcriptional regulator with XRE-family HTH domain
VPIARDPLLRALGARVRHLREARHWTQEELAEHSGLDRSYVAGIEAGLRNPSVKVLSRLGRGLDLTLAGLFDTVE